MNAALTVVSIAGGLAFYVAWLASRLTRLHRRVTTADAALEEARLRRAKAAAELAEALRDDAARSSLATAVIGAIESSSPKRVHAENELTKALRRAGASAPDEQAWQRLSVANRQLAVARQVYNDAVRDTVALRGRRLPRALRLAAGHPTPEYFDITVDL